MENLRYISYAPSEFMTGVSSLLYIFTKDGAETLAEGSKTSDPVNVHKLQHPLQDLLEENIFQCTF